MNTLELLDALQAAALHDEGLRNQLIASRDDHYPLSAFCKVARAAGYELYEMDVVNAGEDFHASMKRSTNGGGENSPMLIEGDDLYEQFFAAIM